MKSKSLERSCCVVPKLVLLLTEANVDDINASTCFTPYSNSVVTAKRTSVSELKQTEHKMNGYTMNAKQVTRKK